MLPVLVRESPNIDAKLYATFDYGHERSVPLNGLSEADIDARLALMVDIAETLPRAQRMPLEDAVVDANHEYYKWRNLPQKSIRDKF